ncbi:MAG: MBL fold metallo-hydrolase [Planctomycetota bacterium]|nr:MBL fold metallo-hydrolase [Planctomycetota bacterium]
MSTPAWERLSDGLFLLRDSCLVYAVRGASGVVLVNAGTGRAAEILDEVAGGLPVSVILTHHFRDHSDGAIRLRQAGAQILAPYWEGEHLVDPEQCHRSRQIWNSYNNQWDHFSPVRPVPVGGWLHDYETRTIGGLDWTVVPTPGPTPGASSYLVRHGGRTLAFVGELIVRAGQVGRLAPLQYNYNDFLGAHNTYHSLNRLMEPATPDLLLPSMLGPIEEPARAVSALKQNLRALDRIQAGMGESLNDLDGDDIEEVLPHLFRSKHAVAETHFVVSESGKVLSIDYGYHMGAMRQPQTHHLSNRRPLLHGLNGLRKRFGVQRIDAVLMSHYHDDHCNGVPMLQRLFGTEVLAGENFCEILEQPHRYERPCLWHEPIKVARPLKLGETTRWENIPITVYPMSGHTRFSTLLCLEVDGTRVVHTGDQIFFRGKPATPAAPGTSLFTNHVYRNGLDLGCYRRTLEDLKRFRPDLVLTGHTRPYRTSPEWYALIEAGAAAFDETHAALMPLGEDEVHFGPESQAAKLKPYRLHLQRGGRAAFDGWVLNPFSSAQTARLEFVLPEGWLSSPVEVDLGPREKKSFRIELEVPATARVRRQAVALDLTVGGRPFGQVAEALVTVGSELF